jgi:hypothetical protein
MGALCWLSVHAAGSYCWWLSCVTSIGVLCVCTWAQDERPADLHMAQPNVPVSKTGQFLPAKIAPVDEA